MNIIIKQKTPMNPDKSIRAAGFKSVVSFEQSPADNLYTKGGSLYYIDPENPMMPDSTDIIMRCAYREGEA